MYECSCLNGRLPNVTDFYNTLPSLVCWQWIELCKNDQDNEDPTQCQSVQCGVRDPGSAGEADRSAPTTNSSGATDTSTATSSSASLRGLASSTASAGSVADSSATGDVVSATPATDGASSDVSTSTSTPTPSSLETAVDQEEDGGSGGLNQDTSVAIGAGVGVGGSCLLLGLGLGFLLRRRKANGANSTAPEAYQDETGYSGLDAKPELDGSDALPLKTAQPSELPADHDLHELTTGEVQRHELTTDEHQRHELPADGVAGVR